MKLKKIKKITGKIEVITGLHIGAGSDTIEIGGMDNPIIKNPFTNEPYIPGSSLKGKMRSLMEWNLGLITNNDGKPCQCGKCDVCRIFGSSADTSKLGPGRLIMRDAFLSEESKERFQDGNALEEKSENTINRITAKAMPRPLERVTPGILFNFDFSFKVFDMDKDGNYLDKIVLKAMKLLELDYLGGGGSRGNGKIKFLDLKDEEGKEINLPEV